MKIKVNWLIPSDEGTFEVDLDDLDLTAEEWEAANEDERQFILEDYMLNRDLISYANLDSYEELNG